MTVRKVQLGVSVEKNIVDMLRFIAYHKKLGKGKAAELAIAELYTRCMQEVNTTQQ